MPQPAREFKAKALRGKPGHASTESVVENDASPEQREVLKLQRLAGNAAVTEVLQRQAPNPEEEPVPASGSTLMGMDLGKLIGQSSAFKGGPATTKPFASASGTTKPFASASGTVDSGAGGNLREAPAGASTPSAGGTSTIFGMDIGKMLGQAGVLGGPNLPGPEAAPGPPKKGNIGEQMSFKSGGGSGLGNIPKMLEGAGVLGGPNLPGPSAAPGPPKKGNIGEQMSFKSGGGSSGLGNLAKTLEGAGVLGGPKLPGPEAAAAPGRKGSISSAELAASADRFIQNAVALGVPGVAELAVQIRAALAGRT